MTGGVSAGRALVWLALLAVPLVSACSLQTDCTQTGVYGIQVAVEDSVSFEPIADSSFGTVVAIDGYVDTLGLIELYIDGRPWRLGGAADRPGTYDVFVRRPRYVDWELREVVVAAGNCGVMPVQLRARMCPVGSSCAPGAAARRSSAP